MIIVLTPAPGLVLQFAGVNAYQHLFLPSLSSNLLVDWRLFSSGFLKNKSWNCIPWVFNSSKTLLYLYTLVSNSCHIFFPWEHYVCIYTCALSHFSHVWLFCDPMDCSPPDSSVHGILQARILEWISMPSSRGSSRPRDWTRGLLHLLHCRQILCHWATGEASVAIHAVTNGSISFFLKAE